MLPKTIWGWVIYVAGALVALALGAVALLLAFLPLADLRGDFERELSKFTGRKVEIVGRLDVSFFPVAGFTAREVRIANAEGGAATYLAEVREISSGLELIPFVFSREIVIDRLILTDPQIHLELDRQGRPNWDFTRPGAAPSPSEPAEPSRPSRVRDIRLKEISIQGGRIDYLDQRDGDAWAVDNPVLRTSMSSLDERMAFEGEATYRGERVILNGFVEEPRAILAGRPTMMQATVESGPMGARFNGTISLRGEYFSGRASALGPSFARVVDWLAVPFSPSAGFGEFELTGVLQANNQGIRFTTQEDRDVVKLDAVSGRGDVRFATLNDRPFISGVLRVDAFDLNPYIAPSAEVAATAEAGEEPTAEAAAAAVAAVSPNAQQRWPTTPIDLSVLRAVDLNLEITTGSLRVLRMQTGRAQLSMVQMNGYIAATLTRVELYGGTGTGRFELDVRGPKLRFVQQFNIQNIQVQDFLRDAINFPVIEGPANVVIDWAGEGANQQEIFSSLRGRASLAVANGALRGVDLGGVVTTIQNAVGGRLGNPNARSRFSRLTGTFALADGQMATRDLRMNLDHLGISANGVLDIGRQQMNVRVVAEEGVISIPFVVRGDWNALEYRPDLLGGERRNVENAVNAVYNRAPPAVAAGRDAAAGAP